MYNSILLLLGGFLMGKNKNHELKDKKSHKTKSSAPSKPVWHMSHAPTLDTGYHWTQDVPIIIFTAVIIMITFMKTYSSPMEGYYWHSDKTVFADFFSYYKSVFIMLMGTLSALTILYRIMTQSLYIKKTKLYIPMAIYACFVILSWVFSEYPYFAFHGFNDRFEGSLVLISYIFMVFYVINTVNTEKSIKRIIYATGVTSSILGILGMSQFLNHDFFQTDIGKKLITPKSYIDNIDKLKFSFTNREIYQTVYNINYVSFYLTLLIPIFGLLFITEKNIKKKLIFGAVSALLIFNLVGSKSSGGILGIGIAFIVALIILNKKLMKWWKSIAFLLVSVATVFALTFNILMPEITNAIKGSFERDADANQKQFIDYFDTDYDKLTISCNNEPLTIQVDMEAQNSEVSITDKEGAKLFFTKEDDGYIIADDQRFSMYSFNFIKEDNTNYIVVNIEDSKWRFMVTKEGILFYNNLNKLVDLDPVPGIGFEDQLTFGSGRGLIWSRSLPLVKEHVFIGSGADTYVFEFPQNDYAAKYNADWPIYNIVDKPHNLYLGIAVNTGLISLISLLILFGAYIVWSIKIYWRNQYEDFISIVGVGIFIGICGFLTAALVNDSSVSVMPLFYGLLGVGIAINMKLSSQA